MKNLILTIVFLSLPFALKAQDTLNLQDMDYAAFKQTILNYESTEAKAVEAFNFEVQQKIKRTENVALMTALVCVAGFTYSKNNNHRYWAGTFIVTGISEYLYINRLKKRLIR